MNTKTPIKIIKRGRGEGTDAEAALMNTETATTSARAVVRAAVSSWVREFQQQRRTNPKRAFGSLFEERTSYSEAG